MAVTVIFLRWPIKDMPHFFVLFCFVLFFCFVVVVVVVVDRALKSNYRVINEKLSRGKYETY